MPRIALDLNKDEDRQKVKGQWRVAPGLVPGQPNEGLIAQIRATPARLADYDDSGWEVCTNVRESRSVGFTFAWYRITVEIPARLDGEHFQLINQHFRGVEVLDHLTRLRIRCAAQKNQRHIRLLYHHIGEERRSCLRVQCRIIAHLPSSFSHREISCMRK